MTSCRVLYLLDSPEETQLCWSLSQKSPIKEFSPTDTQEEGWLVQEEECQFALHALCYRLRRHKSKSVKRESDNTHEERWGAGVETQKNVRGKIGGWGRVPFNEPYAPSLSTIYDGA